MKKFFLTALLMSVLCGVSYATDIPITPTGPVFKLLPAPTWGISGPTGFNNNFFFTPLSQNESVCVFVKNNNTTNLHTFTASISINSDPANVTPSDGTWQVGAFSTLFAAVSPGQPAGIGVSVSGAAQVSVNFSASGTVAGSPETANVVIVQTTGNCFSGTGFIGSAPSTVSSVTPIQAISEGLSQAFANNANSNSFVNPVTGAVLMHVNANGGLRSIYLDRAVITTTVASTVVVQITSTVGTTNCTATTAINVKAGSTVTSTASVNISTTPGVVCNTAAQANILLISIPAFGSVTIDLRGIILPSGTTEGIAILQSGGITGTEQASFFWYEK